MKSRMDKDEVLTGVYLVEYDNGCCKVGHSTDLRSRIAQHRSHGEAFQVKTTNESIYVTGIAWIAKHIEKELLVKFRKRCKVAVANEYFYGISNPKALFSKVCNEAKFITDHDIRTANLARRMNWTVSQASTYLREKQHRSADQHGSSTD